MTLLITGANGTISSNLVTRLADMSDLRLRTLVRHRNNAPDIPGVETVVGDLERPASLDDAFHGVDTLWLLNSIGPQAPHASSNAVWAARQAGVEHIVRLSAMGAAHDAPTRNGRLHALNDVELRASGIPYTIVKPSVFMQNLLGILIDGTFYHTWGSGRVSLIDARDIAEFAARILIEPAAHGGREYTITGPTSVTISDVAATFTDILGTSITQHAIPPDAAVAAMQDSGQSEWVAEVIAREYGTALAAGWADRTTPDLATVLRRPARTTADFARDHHAHLTAASGAATGQ